jgi:hypothetical protein
MSWSTEWKTHLQNVALETEWKDFTAGKRYEPTLRKRLEQLCNRNELVYQPALYNEYITWETENPILILDVSFDKRIRMFKNISHVLHQQVDELRMMEQYEKAAKQHFYHHVSILERMSLAIAYIGNN